MPPSRLEWQAGEDADTALAELPQNCDWGCKRDAHGKPKHWKGGKVHAAVTRDGTDERFFSHLLDSHGGRHVRVRTPKKASQHLMHGVLVIAVEQTLRMLC